MLLQKIEMRNFGPYYLDHELEFADRTSGPVTLIHGENLRGKTSLLNAIRWCLYGSATARSEGDIPSYELISYDAAGEGDFTMKVVVKFTHEDDTYVMSRHVQSNKRPRSDGDLEERVHLEKNGQFVGSEQVERHIRRILHPKVSRFFLFDAELLEDYEVLVGDEEYYRETVKDSIERILGLPALTSARLSLSELEQSAAKAQNKQVKAREKNERLVGKEEQLQSEVEGLEDDLQTLVAEGQELKETILDLRKQLKESASARADVQRIEKLEEEIEERVEKRESLRSECHRRIQEGWWQPVAWRVEEELEEIEGELEEESEVLAKLEQLRSERAKLEKAVGEGMCPLCGCSIDEEAREVLKSRLEETREALDEWKERRSASGVSFARANRLREYESDAEIRRVVALEERIRKLSIEIDEREREIGTIRDRLRNVDEDDVRELQEEYDRCIEDRAALRDDVDDVRERLQEKRDNLQKTRRKIANLPEADPKVRANREIYQVLGRTFDSAVEKFIRRVRSEVQEQASEIFSQLIREPDYRELEINEHYGLHIIDEDGRTIRRRSAGGAQIVALSLVGALNQCAVREGPLVIDTPLARLDDQHRENVLRRLPDLVPQVVLLVQSGELGDEERGFLRGKLGREYRLIRDGSPTKTCIEEVELA